MQLNVVTRLSSSVLGDLSSSWFLLPLYPLRFLSCCCCCFGLFVCLFSNKISVIILKLAHLLESLTHAKWSVEVDSYIFHTISYIIRLLTLVHVCPQLHLVTARSQTEFCELLLTHCVINGETPIAHSIAKAQTSPNCILSSCTTLLWSATQILQYLFYITCRKLLIPLNGFLISMSKQWRRMYNQCLLWRGSLMWFLDEHGECPLGASDAWSLPFFLLPVHHYKSSLLHMPLLLRYSLWEGICLLFDVSPICSCFLADLHQQAVLVHLNGNFIGTIFLWTEVTCSFLQE